VVSLYRSKPSGSLYFCHCRKPLQRGIRERGWRGRGRRRAIHEEFRPQCEDANGNHRPDGNHRRHGLSDLKAAQEQAADVGWRQAEPERHIRIEPDPEIGVLIAIAVPPADNDGLTDAGHWAPRPERGAIFRGLWAIKVTD
jgi:hypothetical protein